ncbi:hypothetical protein BDQ17DRAFT_1408193 [Cyathus striatus]|nr:hypothetical protein BDQ17DRAFT_1408193 [Cyathus striatus]
MSRRPMIEEEFDDDTDLPLPSQPLPNTGLRGPLLQEIDISDDELEPHAGPASPSRPSTQSRPTADGSRPQGSVTDITPYKSWTCIYPIYLDAKRPYGTGQRRVERAKSLWWPLSKDIAEAANRLGLGTLHEVNKSHPRDWENPGRVRVQWKKDGRLVNLISKPRSSCWKWSVSRFSISSQRTFQSRHITPCLRKPFLLLPPNRLPLYQPRASNQLQQIQVSCRSAIYKDRGRRLPIPPEPLPPLANRVSAYSPALSTGVLIDAVKAGMNSSENPALGSPSAAPGGMQKGKRKVVRVRG